MKEETRKELDTMLERFRESMERIVASVDIPFEEDVMAAYLVAMAVGSLRGKRPDESLSDVEYRIEALVRKAWTVDLRDDNRH